MSKTPYLTPLAGSATFTPMHLSQCRQGEIVRETHVSSERRIGHVVGLTANPTGEVIPLVLFARVEKPEAVHHGNLALLACDI